MSTLETSNGDRFALGRLVIAHGAAQKLPIPEVVVALFGRHAKGDWGDVCHEAAERNEAALKYGTRLLSAYTTSKGTKYWIITEGDRSLTTVLLPEEY